MIAGGLQERNMGGWVVIGLGALCVLGGFALAARGIGGAQAGGTIKVLGVEIQLQRVGPGVIFATLGVGLIVWATRDGATSTPAGRSTPTTAAATEAPSPSQKPAETAASGPAPAPASAPAAAAVVGVSNTGNVTNQVNCVYVINTGLTPGATRVESDKKCGMTVQNAKTQAAQNLDLAANNLQAILSVKSQYFFPALADYRGNPSPEQWKLVRDQARLVRELVNDSIKSMVAIDPSVQQHIPKTLSDISRTQRSRAVSLFAVEEIEQPPTPEEVDRIEKRQRELYTELAKELAEFRAAALSET
jgi:hypothetical protein